MKREKYMTTYKKAMVQNGSSSNLLRFGSLEVSFPLGHDVVNSHPDEGHEEEA